MVRTALLLAALITTTGAHGAEPAPLRVILVGDSTMASGSGYGDALCARFQPEIACVNVARRGRSSASFRAEGAWDDVQALLRAGAGQERVYVLIQFGHNDQPGKPGRSTSLDTEFPANIRRYATDVMAAGAVPILVTPLTRRIFKDGTLNNDLLPWAQAVQRTGSALGIDVVDLNGMSAAAVQAMGSAQADTLAEAPPGTMAPAKPGQAPKSLFDYTHVGPAGATVFSAMVASELARVRPELKSSLVQP